ncbi:hypothetical protein BJ085DRAFT_28478 [Dimargaris cristalligena]|uniref:Uncharacterized protein n=1 Tax=Dimargaris cristalligena TaxID=215637 RepID=A0A4P9ZNH8_9FUNG|nr:hypothetical protein BJ085DRAFT_28478 [Dimargaris cristalligena]|eukprot:RKP34843.1 hypothetical protein BJ085DRAFT_28478 [Dimargaris cristalligena]
MSVAKLSGSVVAVTCLLSLAVSISATGKYSVNPAQVSTEQNVYQIGDYIPGKGILSWAQSPRDLFKPPTVDQTRDQDYPNTMMGQAPPLPPLIECQAGDFKNYPTNFAISTGFGKPDYTYPHNGPGTVDDRASEQPHPITSSAGPIRIQKGNQQHQGANGWMPYAQPSEDDISDLITEKEFFNTCVMLSGKAFSQGYPDVSYSVTFHIQEILRRHRARVKRDKKLADRPNRTRKPRGPDNNLARLSEFRNKHRSGLESPSLLYTLEWNAKLQTVVAHFFTGGCWNSYGGIWEDSANLDRDSGRRTFYSKDLLVYYSVVTIRVFQLLIVFDQHP